MSNDHKLSGPQIQQVLDALLDGYPAARDLREMVLIRLGEHLDQVAEGGNHRAQSLSLVEWAQRNGRTAELIAGAYNHTPGNSALSRLVQQALNWPPCKVGGLTLLDGRAAAFALRDRELAYLDGLLTEYEEWAAYYTPLAGVTEVAASAPRRKAPRDLMPPEFDLLVERGALSQPERVPVDEPDLREAVRKYKRLVLAGEPGSGKTTTLQMLRREYALAAKEDVAAPLPVLAPLGGYDGEEAALEYVAGCAGALGPHLLAYLHHGRALLLLDALNEMPQRDRGDRVGRIQTLLDRGPAAPVVVTCRALDYEHLKPLRLQKLEVKPLDADRQLTYCRHYLGDADGDALFWKLAGDEAAAVWQTWRRAGGTWDGFWHGDGIPDAVYQITTGAQDALWRELRAGQRAPLLALSANPYMLAMLIDLYVRGDGDLPQNRAQVFRDFVTILLAREEDRRRKARAEWPGTDKLRAALAELAFAMQRAGGRGTAVERPWAEARLPASGCTADEMLDLGAGATLLDISGGQVRFVHQLLQEHFAALAWESRLAAGDDLRAYWPGGWAEPSGWEETAVLLAVLLPDMTAFVEALLPVNPPLAARCTAESGGARPGAETIRKVQGALIAVAESLSAPAQERNAAGNALNHLGDPRPGVGVKDGLPDIAWCDVPEGEFLMGSDDADEYAFDEEKPQQRVTLGAFRISRYPITNAQFQAFVEDGGYTDRWRECWTVAGWRWRLAGGISGPQQRGGAYDLSNRPVVGVSWYEAAAFCTWLSHRLGRTVLLPSEAQWEKAARGTDGRRYPHGQKITPEYANYQDTEIRTTSAVGIFPKGNSPYGLLDMAGNVWEWTSSLYKPYPYDAADGREDPEAEGARTWRGGGFIDYDVVVRCAYRFDYVPDDGYDYIGFRVVSPGF